MKWKNVTALFLAAILTLQSPWEVLAISGGDAALAETEALEESGESNEEDMRQETQEGESQEELDGAEANESQEELLPEETETEELQERPEEEKMPEEAPEEPKILEDPNAQEEINQPEEPQPEPNAAAQESFTLTTGKVTDKGSLGNGFSWTLDDKGVFTIKSSAGVNGFGDRITQISGLSEAKRRQVKTVYFEGGTWQFGTYDDSLFPSAQTLVLGKNVRSYYDNQDRYNPDGTRKNTTIKNVQILGAAGVSLHKYLALETVQASGNMGGLLLTSCSRLQSISVTGSTQSVSAEDCTALKTVYVKKWRSAEKWFGNFSGDTSLESLEVAEMPSDSWALGGNVFAGCANLKKIKVNAKLREIGCESNGNKAPFYGCDALEEFPDFRYVERLGDYAFADCTNLKEADFPNLQDKQVLTSVFKGCVNLERVSLSGPHMNTVGLEFTNFQDCVNLKSVEIDADITEIGQSEFENCSALTDFPDFSSVKTIDRYAFLNCKGLERITVRESLSSIGDSAFEGCTGLKQVYFQGVEEWSNAESAFENCVSLENMVIGEMKKPASFSGRTFYNCGKLKNLVMPKGISSLNEQEFYGCASLRKLPDLSELKYVNTSYTKDRTQEVFYGCSSLEEVTFPETVDIDGEKRFMFAGCTSLKKVVIPENIDNLGPGMFSGCASLERIEGLEKAENLEGIKDGAFSGCKSMKELELPDTVRYISSYPEGLEVFKFPSRMSNIKLSYASTPNLKEIVIPETVSILKGAFKDHGALEKVTLMGSKQEIPEETFSGCSNLKEVRLPAGLAEIKERAFYNCSRLESLQLPEGTAKIGEFAFSGCANLKSVQLPDSLQTIERKAFENCASLADADLPKGLTALGEEAFLASGLKEVEIPGGLSEIKPQTFYECPNLTRVSMSGGSKNIRDGAFSGGLDKVILGGEALQLNNRAISNAREVIIDSPNVTMTSSALEMREGVAKIYFMQGVLNFGEGSILQKSVPGVANHLYVYIDPEVSAISGTLAKHYVSATIVGEKGSIAEEYAKKNGYAFLPLGGEEGDGTEAPDDGVNIQNGFQYEIENGKATVVEYIGKSGDVRVPETLGGRPVAKIKAGAFQNRILASSGESVKKIYFPASVETVEPGFASSWIASLKEVTVDAANPYLTVQEGGLYSKDMKKLILALPYAGKISIPDTVQVIGSRAFSNTHVSEVILPDSVKRLEENSFSGQDLQKVVLPETLEEIGPRAFAGSGLSELKIPVGVKVIGEEAFDYSSLEHLDLPDTVEVLGDRAFSSQKKMMFVTLGENIKTIGADVFQKSERCAIYGISKSEAEQKFRREYPEQYERGTALGHYTLGISVQDKTEKVKGRIKEANWMRHTSNTLYVELTKPMKLIEGSQSGVVDCATGEKTVEGSWEKPDKIDESEIGKTEDLPSGTIKEFGIGKVRDLPSDTEFAVVVEAGSLKDPETGEVAEEWDSRGVWSKRMPEDFWRTANPKEEIPQALYHWMFGNGKGMVQNMANSGKDGICFGLAATAALVRNGQPDISTFSQSQLYKTAPEYRSSALGGLNLKTYWQLAYLLQITPEVSKSMEKTKNDYEGMIAAVKAMVADKKDMYVIAVENWGGGYHALLPYSIGESKDGTIIEMEVYDCNHPDCESVLQIYKKDGEYIVRELNDQGQDVVYKGIKYWKITDRINQVAKAYVNGEPCPDLGGDVGDVLNILIPKTPVDPLMEAENMIIRQGAKNAAVENGEVKGEGLTEIPQTRGGSADLATSSHLYWTEGKSAVEISGLNKKVQVALTGDYSQVQAGGCNGTSVRLDAADSPGETTQAEFTTGRKNQFQIKIEYPGEPKKEIESIELSGTAAKKAVVQDSAKGALVEGADKMSVTVVKDGKEKKEDLTKLDQYKKIEISVDKKTDQMVVKGDTNGDGKMDETINVSKPVQKVNKIKLSQTQLSLYPTQKAKLTAQALPSSATNKSVKFTSASPAVASVTATGAITAKKAGTAQIKATAQDGSGVTAVCKVTVKKASVKLNAAKLPLQKNKSTAALAVRGMVKGDKIASWVSSNPKIVSVAANGKLKAGKKLGKSTITVKTKFGAKAQCVVTVQKKSPALKSFTVAGKEKAISKNKVTLKKGNKLTLIISRNPITATEKLKYASSAPKVASVTQKGVIKAKKKGKCKITIKSGSGKKKTITVTVK